MWQTIKCKQFSYKTLTKIGLSMSDKYLCKKKIQSGWEEKFELRFTRDTL